MSILFCQCYDTVSQCLFYIVNVMILYRNVEFILPMSLYSVCQCYCTLSQCRFYSVNVMILYRSVDFILSVL